MYAKKLTGGDAWRILAELHGHSSAVTCLALDRNGRLISGSRDKTLRVWDLHEITKRVQAAGEYTEFSGQEAVAVTLHVIEADEHNPNGHESWVTDVAVNEASSVAVSTSYDSTLRVWSLEDGALGQNLRVIACALNLHSLRLERLSITDTAEFAFVCGQSGVFQVWRLIDGLQLPAIKWGGLVDVVDENRITNFGALSISRGAALVVTCRNADIMLWDSESADGIAGIFGHAPDRQLKSISIKTELKAKFAVQAANDRSEDTQPHRKTVKEQVQMKTSSKSGIKEIQNAKIIRVASSGSSRTGRSHSSSSKSTHKEEKSEKQAVKHSGSAANEDGSQIDGPSVGISASKILKLPGILKDSPSTRELESAQEYRLIKLQIKSVLRGVKQKIKEASKFGLKQEAEAAVAPPTKIQRRAPVAVSTAPLNASNSEIKAHNSLSKSVLPRWTTNVKNSLSQVCLLQEKGHESSFRAVLGHERNPALLILHSEDLVHGKYFWTVQLQTDCRIRVGIISKAATDLPFTFDPEAEEDNENLSLVSGIRLPCGSAQEKCSRGRCEASRGF
mmetsp:Transcript_4482/g.6603  ORF Transcript_4482/g.6603 Transcript_4482/m.6603 type:complete len:562 (+) Transcript_4482:2471-4156(+)